jgi:ATP-binding cassette subfamily C (CFTR/MRP) protein 4
LLENGDETLVGERGITLSGGQKARLALARALYANGDIYLLDDPISAVDAKVAKEIYEKVILHLSKEKTLILVTHQINYLLECDQVLIFDKGEVIHNDKPQNLRK